MNFVTTKATKQEKKKGWRIVFVSAFMGFVLAATFPQFSMTVGYLSEKLLISESMLLFSDTIKALFIVVSMLVSGVFYKKLGARKVFLIALVCMALPQFTLPYASNIPILFLLKAAQGFSSIVFPVFLLIIMDVMEDSKTGLATAVFNGIFYGGAGLGATFTGFLMGKTGWLSTYFALGIIQILVGILWLIIVNPSKITVKSEEQERGKKGKSILKMPVVWLLIIAFFSTTWTIQAITVDMPIYGKFLGYSDMAIGSILTASTIGMVLACLVSGKVSDLACVGRQNRKKARIVVLMVGPILIILGIVALMLADLTHFMMFYIVTLLLSFGASWGLGSFYCILPEIFSNEELPIVTGFAGGVGDMGMPLAPLVVGVVFGINGFWEIGWLMCAVVAIFSLVACLLLLREQTHK